MRTNIFDEINKGKLKTLQQYVPIVDRVHGASHPEFHDVRRVFEEIFQKVGRAGENRPELESEFKKLRDISNNYTVPDDVCESYEAVYNMLSEVDEAYHS